MFDYVREYDDDCGINIFTAHLLYVCLITHSSDVIMGAMASQISSLDVFCSTVEAQVKENIKAPRYWPLCGEFTGDRRIPRTNGQ